MLDLAHLTRPPFSLDREAIDWVRNTYEALDERARVGQVFHIQSRGSDREERERLARVRPGGITRFFGPDGPAERQRLAEFQQDARVPLLVSADLEGSRMSLPFGTQVPNPIALAAIDDPAITEEVVGLMAAEARAVGLNWSFTPVLDINAMPRSAIVATRGFGSDPERIRRHALIQIRTFQRAGLAATAKHWPGEGHDDRDQHLVTTINPLSMDDWEQTHGALYRAAIEAGVMSVMSAHIALPAFARENGVPEGAELYRPASVSSLLNRKLLRDKLGFNGLIVSDASEMAGLSSFMGRIASKIEILNSGCDLVLFSSDPAGEMEAVLAAVRSGRIPADRFAEAVTRVLGLKAALGLHKPVTHPDFPDPDKARARMNEILRKAPVLEKDINGTLPLDPEKHRRVLLFAPGIVEPLKGEILDLALPDLLRTEGFEVTLYKPGDVITPEAHDIAIYAFAEETLLTRGRIFLDWFRLGGGLHGAMRRLWHEMPVVMVSFGYPYYLYDAPQVPVYINAWATMDPMQEAVVDLLLGRAPFNRNSPIDAFAGVPNAHY